MHQLRVIFCTGELCIRVDTAKIYLRKDVFSLMTIRKILARGLLPSLLAVSLMGTYSGVAMAEDTVESDDDPYTLVLALTSSDMQFTFNPSKVCYPSLGYAKDVYPVLKMNGKTYNGTVRNSSSPIVSVNHDGYKEAMGLQGQEVEYPGLSELGLDVTPISNVETRYVVFYLDEKPTSGTITLDADISAYVEGCDVSDYDYEFISYGKTPSSTLSFSESDLEHNLEVYLVNWGKEDVPNTIESENDYILHLDITGGKSGLNSFQLVDIPVGKDDKSASDMYYAREKYGADSVTDMTFTLDGSSATQNIKPVYGTTYFNAPTKWDSSLERYTCTSNFTVDMLGIENFDSQGFTIEGFELGVPDTAMSALDTFYNINALHREWFDAKEDDGVDPSNKDEDKPIQLEPMMNTADMYDSTLTLNVDSKLSKYNTSLLNSTPEMRIRGEATQTYLDNNARSDASLGDMVTWGTVDAISSGKTSVSVDAGSYSIDASDSISVKVSGDATVKSGKTKEIKAVVEPRYSLKVTSEAGVVNCTIDGASYNGDALLLFATEGNIAYTIKDKDSGKTYSVVMTDADPYKELVLGSAGAEDVGLVDEFEDVPNTADPITTIMIIVGVLAVLFAGSFVLVYRANKKNERG